MGSWEAVGTRYLEQMCVHVEFCGGGEGREKLVSLKKTNDVPPLHQLLFSTTTPTAGKY